MLSAVFLLAAFVCTMLALLLGVFECLFIALGCLLAGILDWCGCSVLLSVPSGLCLTTFLLVWYVHRIAKVSASIDSKRAVCDFVGQRGVIREITNQAVYASVSGTLWEIRLASGTPSVGMAVEVIGFADDNALMLLCRAA